MTHEAKVTLKYDSVWNHKGGIYDDEILPEEHFTFEVPAEDLNAIQLFQLFEKFCFAMGHNQAGIAKGAAYVAFNDMRTTEEMRKTAEEYDLVLVEDYRKKLAEYDAQQDEEIKKLEAEIRELKEKLARVLPKQYEQPSVTKQVLETAYKVCKDCGKKYGEYSAGCSSVWEGECDVCGETKGVTEARDYGYLEKGIVELSK
jgi:vacuolar-type H+-ATPase subunit I/STV1